MQFLKNVILISLDRSKCTAHSDMLSSIPMKFKKMQNKNFIHIRHYMCYTLQFRDTFQELKTICPFRFRYVFISKTFFPRHLDVNFEFMISFGLWRISNSDQGIEAWFFGSFGCESFHLEFSFISMLFWWIISIHLVFWLFVKTTWPPKSTSIQ